MARRNAAGSRTIDALVAQRGHPARQCAEYLVELIAQR